ncbi:hypothetical protein GCM10023075_51750 [Streptosporangium album]
MKRSGRGRLSDRVAVGVLTRTFPPGRVDAAPLKVLFEQARGPVGGPDTPGVWWRGRRLTAIDGFTLDLPDSPANRTEFGGPTDGAFPQVRCVAHAEVGTRALIDAAFGPYSVGEQTLTRDLIGDDGAQQTVSELFCLATTMLDPTAAPMEEIPALYRQRWEGETAIGAIKTTLRGDITVRLRSHQPDGVRQEVWALLCVYQALCELIADAAATPTRPSNTTSAEHWRTTA